MGKKRKKKGKGRKRSGNPSPTSQVRKLFRSQPTKLLSFKQIVKRIKGDHSKEDIYKAVQKLVKAGELSEPHSYRFQAGAKRQLTGKVLTGVVDMTSSGFAFIMVDELNQDVYVNRKNKGTALDGDLVEVQLFARQRGKRVEGQVIAIKERAQSQFIGTLQISGSFAFLIPDKKNMPVDIIVPINKLGKGKNGEKVLVEIIEWPKTGNPVGEVTEVMGKSGSDDVAMSSILLSHGFFLKFPAKVTEQLEQVGKSIKPEEIERRRDMRDTLTFTIDPVDAKDFDDAISYKKLSNGHFEIGIHIADVTHYVPPGTAIDKEAAKRATSVYLADRVAPMLPELLSNELCSLRPNEDKLTFSVVVEMDAKGKIHDQWIGRTVIHSDQRFAYEDVQEILDSGKGKHVTALKQVNKLAKALRETRFAEGSIGFETTEVRFELDDKGKPIGVILKVRKEAHLLIEDLMLLANRLVASELAKASEKKEVPFVYRVHDIPDQDKLAQFKRFAEKFGHDLDTTSPQQTASSLNALMEAVQGKPEQDLLEKLAIRSMAKAFYTTRNIGHYGLGFENYTHFTSPIRRYPDMMVHRALQLYLDGKPGEKKIKLEAKCKHSSVMEKRAAEAERESTKYKKVQFMQDKVGEDFDGIISGVTEWGLFVEIIENKCEGLVRMENLNDDFYQYDEYDLCLVGMETGKKFQLGEMVRIKVAAANLDARTLDYELIS